MKYIIAPITTYNEFDELFETKVAADYPGLPLVFCSFGRTEKDSRDNAEAMVSILEEAARISSYFKN